MTTSLELWQEKIATYFKEPKTRTGITVNLIILGLIFLSCAIFVLGTFPIPDPLRQWLNYTDTLILFIFAIEYLIRLWTAPSKIQFIFSVYSLIDLLAIIPLLIGFIDLRYFRIFRWFRLLRIIRFFEVELAFFHIPTEDGVIITRILLTLFTIIFVYSGLIYQVEHQANPTAFKTFLDALYFSVVTMTTVGYGDVTPLSEIGRLLTILMIATGVLFIPWQLNDLVKQLLKTSFKVSKSCLRCGLSAHDADANFCKNCGFHLNESPP